jgi:hypothetical protein
VQFQQIIYNDKKGENTQTFSTPHHRHEMANLDSRPHSASLSDVRTSSLILPKSPLPEQWGWLDGIVVINVEDKDKRLVHARRELQKQGLDKCTTYVRRRRGLNFLEACYESHRAVCKYALSKGWRTMLICEDDLHFVKDLSGHALGERVRKLEPGWMRLMLGYVPISLWMGRNKSGKKGSTIATTSYVASVDYMKYMDATPFAMVIDQSQSPSNPTTSGPGLDWFQSARLSKWTYVEWPSPVFVEPEAGKDNDHPGSIWDLGISVPTQHFLQHVFWLIPVLICLLVVSAVVIIVAVHIGAKSGKVATARAAPDARRRPLDLGTLSPYITS